MYVGATLVTLLVTALMLVPFLRPRERPVNRGLFLWGGGVALPLLTLTALVPYVMTVGHETRAATTPEQVSVDVTGCVSCSQLTCSGWAGSRGSPPANELDFPVGEP